MADKYYPIPENPHYNTEIRELQDNDPASATDIFNPLVERLIENTHAVKKESEQKIEALRNSIDTLPPSAPPTFEIGEDGHLYAIYEED